jgi:Fe-S-cluster containining protein
VGELAQRQLAHWPEAQEIAERNCQRTQMPYEAFNATMAKIRKPGQFKNDRLTQLIELATRFSDALIPQSACREGCSHCCYIAVPLSRTEAERIAHTTKRTLTEPLDPIPMGQKRPLPLGYDNPCPFLKDNLCSIYSARPLACRTCVNMDDTPLLCELDPESTSDVPYADATPIWLLGAAILGRDTWADIRDWFRD